LLLSLLLLLQLLLLLPSEAFGRQGNTMTKANMINKLATLPGWLACIAVAMALDGPAVAQGGANCLFQCDSQCYGQQGPYCRSGCMARCNSNQNSSGRPDTRPSASFGAIAATATTGKFYGYSFGWSSQAEAEREALAICNREAGAA